jgi:hypothetical protein
MTNATQHRLERIERRALWFAVAGSVIAAICGFLTPAAVVPAWRLAVFACLQPALGSLIFVLIFRLTGGQWMEGLAPFLTAGARMLPWIWLLALPLLFFPIAARATATGDPAPRGSSAASVVAPAVATRTTADSSSAAEHPPPSDVRLKWYFSRPMLVLRALFYAGAFFLLAAGASRTMRERGAQTLRWFGPVGLIGLVFMLHLLATDWIVRLEPGWYSTGFPLVWITGQALAGFAAATAAALWAGADPATVGSSGRRRGFDWGNLLLAAVMAWTYVAFVQWLIIWSGNLPAETSWYRHRSHGGWQWVVVALGVLEFGAPFMLLLSRGLKSRRLALAAIATLLLAGQLAYTIWLIVPAAPPATGVAWGLAVALLVAAAALFLNRYLAAARCAARSVLS